MSSYRHGLATSDLSDCLLFDGNIEIYGSPNRQVTTDSTQTSMLSVAVATRPVNINLSDSKYRCQSLAYRRSKKCQLADAIKPTSTLLPLMGPRPLALITDVALNCLHY